MMNRTTITALHGRLLKDTFGRDISDQDAFLLFALFHHYKVVLPGPILRDRPKMCQGDIVFPITRRDCAKALAAIWRGSGDAKGDYTYWYWRWNNEWGSYGHAEHMTEVEEIRLQELKSRLEAHPFVEQFIPED